MKHLRVSSPTARLRRTIALVRKEAQQVLRDPSSVAIGIVMPILLLVLFGYGLSFDLEDLPMAVVLEETSAEATGAASGFFLSRNFSAVPVKTMREAEQLMLEGTVSGIVRIPSDFARDVALGKGQIQVLVHGVDSNTARIALGYAQGAIATWTAREAAQGRMLTPPAVAIESRMWFNEANNSTHYLVPGLIVLVMTLIGALLTALVVAREWERGTFEAMFVTPARPFEILLGKTVPYFALGLIGLALCVVGGRVLFGVPLRGSILVLIAVSSIYLLVALGIGLVISSVTKSQFVASQVALLATFLPAIMLSGFIFDIRSMPAVIQTLTYVLPARYYVSLLQTLFLAGDIWTVIVPNTTVLVVMALLLLLLSLRATRKQLE